MARARPDIHELPITFRSPTLKQQLIDAWVSLFALVVGLLLLFIAPELWLNITGLLVSLAAMWMAWDHSRRQIIRIDENRVHVMEKQWPRTQKRWEEPISAFRGLQIRTLGKDRKTATFTVQLIHPDSRKTLELYSAAGAPRGGLFGTTDAEWEENESIATEFAYRTVRILNLPVFDNGVPEEKAGAG